MHKCGGETDSLAHAAAEARDQNLKLLVNAARFIVNASRVSA